MKKERKNERFGFLCVRTTLQKKQKYKSKNKINFFS